MQKNAQSLVKQALDFKRRRKDESYAGIAVIALSALAYIAMQGWVIYNILRFTESQDMPWDLPALMSLLGATALLFIFLSIFFTMEFRKLTVYLDCVEFLNLLFSSGMNLHTAFSFVINKDYDIVYNDKKAAALFGYAAIKDFKQLLEHHNVSDRSRLIISTAISQQQSTEIVVTYQDSHEQQRDIRITVDPLARPNGYCVIRGYHL